MSGDDFITLPTGIDFRQPGQMAPWDAKRSLERGRKLNELFSAQLQQAALTNQSQVQLQATFHPPPSGGSGIFNCGLFL